MATPVKRDAPRGRAEVVDVVLDAAERLFARSGPSAVSLRDVAAEAGVTYSLINRHFGTKDTLVDRLLERYADRWVARLGDAPDRRDALDALVGEGPDAGAYLRLLAWTLLNDDPTAEAHRRHALLDRLPRLSPGEEGGDVDPDVATALVLAQVFGWRFFAPFLRDALHLDEAAVRAVHDELRRRATT
jgi:AcrR family transcriptional regulator